MRTLLTIGLLLAIGPGVLLAGDATELFSDDFSTFDQGWGLPNDSLRIEKNKMVLEPLANKTYHASYQANLFNDADIRLKLSQAEGGPLSPAGISFWGDGRNSFYIAALTSGGNFAIYRSVQLHWLWPVSLRKSDAIKTGLGQENELRVVTQGNRATFYVNGKQLATVQGSAPKGGSIIGLHAESFPDRCIWQYSDLKVQQPPASAPATPSGRDPNVLYADDFTTLDPAWGVTSDQFHVEGNKLIVQPKVPAYFSLYQGDLYGDVDVRVKTTQSAGGTASCAAIAFWGGPEPSLYAALLNTNGTCGISRLMNHRWLSPLPAQKSDAIKLGNGQTNELRVVTQGNLATFYINDQRVAQLKGFPPASGGEVGLYAESGTPPSTWQFSDFKILNASSGSIATNIATDSDLILADDFTALDPAWTLGTPQEFKVENHKLIITLPNNLTGHWRYQGTLFDDFDLRVAIEAPKSEHDSAAGVLFWSGGSQDYYAAAIDVNGRFNISRFTGGKYLAPIPWQPSDAIHKGSGQTNNLRLVTKGHSASLYINDKQVAALKGFPPGNSNQIGFYVVSSPQEPAVWKFSNLTVRKAP